MKRIFSLMLAVAMMFSVTFASAQTVENSRTFENVYVTVEGGAISPFMSNNGFVKDLRPQFGVEIGKNVTPVIGFSAEYLCGVNTTGASTWVDQSNLRANLKVNLSNWFGGYKGEPRLVEVSLVPGLGWGHDFKKPGQDKGYNYLTYNTFAQVDFNLGKAKAWQINIKPGVVWAARDGAYGMHKNLGCAQLNVGFTYKFKSKRTKSHNFVMSPYTVTRADYDAVVAERNALRERKPETVEVVKEVIVEKVVEKRVPVPTVAPGAVSFKIGTAKLTDESKTNLGNFSTVVPAGTQVRVTGSADTGTGTAKRNEYLATQRAKAVADVLSENGVNVNEVTTKMNIKGDNKASRTAVVEVVE